MNKVLKFKFRLKRLLFLPKNGRVLNGNTCSLNCLEEIQEMVQSTFAQPTKVKDKDETNREQGAVNKIKCCDCQATYIGETGRNLNVRLTEHKRATTNGDIKNQQ